MPAKLLSGPLLILREIAIPHTLEPFLPAFNPNYANQLGKMPDLAEAASNLFLTQNQQTTSSAPL